MSDSIKNGPIVDEFMALKYPDQAQRMQEVLGAELAKKGINTERDAQEAVQALRELKLKALQSVSNEAGEMLGVTREDLLKLREAQAARKRGSGKKRSAEAMKVAAAAFLDAEKLGLSGREAVDKAEEAIGKSFASGREAETDRTTLAGWLRDIQVSGVTTIPPADKGRPKKK